MRSISRELSIVGVVLLLVLVRLGAAQSADTPLTGHAAAVRCLAFSASGERLASASSDGSVRVWDVKTGKAIAIIPDAHDGGVNRCDITADGKQVVSLGFDRAVRLWRVEDGGCLHTFTGHQAFADGLRMTPDARYAASCDASGFVFVWDLLKRTEKRQIEKVHDSGVRTLMLSPNGKLLITAGNDNSAKVWKFPRGKSGKELAGHEHPILALAVDRRNKTLITGDEGGTLYVWALPRGKRGEKFETDADRVFSLAAHPKKSRVVLGGLRGIVEEWDYRRLKRRRTLEGAEGNVHAVTYSPDGKWIVAGDEKGKIRFWKSE